MDRPLPFADGSHRADSIGTSTAAALHDMVGVIWRHKLLLGASLVLVYTLGIVWYRSQNFCYEARASVLVHRTGDALPSGTVDTAGGSPGYASYLPNHIRLITSSAVLTKAVVKLKESGLPGLAGQTPGDLAAGLKVSCQQDTEILDIAYRTANAQVAAAVVQAVVASYQECVNETHRSTSRELVQILAQQKADLDRQLNLKEAELVALQKAAGVLALRDDRSNIVVSRVAALNQALTQARMRRLELETSYRGLKDAIDHGQSTTVYLLRYQDKLGPELVARSLGGLRSTLPAASTPAERKQLLQDQQELQHLETIYGPNHPKVRLLQDRVRLADQLLSQQKQHAQPAEPVVDLQLQLVRLMEQELQEQQNLESRLQEQFDQEKKQALELNAQNAQLTAVQDELARLKSFYDGFIGRMKQVNLGEDYGTITTQVIDPPQEPTTPISPNLQLILLKCTFLGLGLGLGLCYLFEWWDTSYRGPEDIARHLGLPVLGQVPSIPAPRSGQAIERVVQYAPQSLDAEAFRTLRAALTLCDTPPKRFTVTSSEPEDGKTLIVTNLAIAFAQSGVRTLLIDGDMRRSRLHEIFQLPRTLGLSLLLQQRPLTDDDLAAAVHQTSVDQLDVLPSGPHPPNPAELLISKNFAQFLRWAEANYDRIIFDAPPILAVSDCAIIGRVLDGTLLVVRADKNDRLMTARARDALRGMNCSVLGVIVNGVHSSSTYGYSYYGRPALHDGPYDHEPESSQERAA